MGIQSAEFRLKYHAIFFLFCLASTLPLTVRSQQIPDTLLLNQFLVKIVHQEGILLKTDNPRFVTLKFADQNASQCICIYNVVKNRNSMKLMLFLKKDSLGNWENLKHIIASKYKFIDIDTDLISEIECTIILKKKYSLEKKYMLLSLKSGKSVIMYSYHQFEYTNSTYIMNNFATDSVFSEKHTVYIKDINGDQKPELVDFIEFKYRKQPCCDPHLEYGIRQKKLVLNLINGKFE